MLKNKIPRINDGRYIYASRLSYSCLFEKSFFDSYDILESNGISCTLNEYLDRTIVDPIYKNSIKNKFPKTVLDTLLVDKRHVMDLLKDEVDKLESNFKIKQDACKLYYQNLMCDEDSRVVVFDCGYSGSVSSGISQALNNSMFVDKIYLHETSKNVDLDKTNETKTFILIDDKLNGKMDIFLELMLSSCEGSCLGFVKNQNDSVPVLSNDPSQINKEIIDEIQSEAINRFKYFIELLGPYCKWMNPIRCSMYSELFEEIVIKRKDTISLISKIIFEDDFYGGKKSNLASNILSGRKEWILFQIKQKIKENGIRNTLKTVIIQFWKNYIILLFRRA